MNKKFFNVFIVITLVSLTIACAKITPQTQETKITIHNKKSFPQEDNYIMFALRAEHLGQPQAAAKLFSQLYDKSQNKEYLYRSLANLVLAKKYQETIEMVNKNRSKYPQEYRLVRYKVISLIQMKKLDEALVISTDLVKNSKEPSDYLLMGDIYIKQGKFDIALRYLQSAYVKEYDEKILDKIAIVMYVNLGKKKEAIAQLETHSRIRECSKLICGRLVSFYSNENNVNGILSTYLRFYEKFQDKETAGKIIQIYAYQKEYQKMIDFLEKSKTDDETLLQLYSFTKNYKKAYSLADKLYASSGDITFLGQSAIYEYESANKKNNLNIIKRVINKLQSVLKEDSSPLYENYLGYILIDHEIDIKTGMQHIREVLKVQPKSAYYLDSLAWGYFKLGQCQKANVIMNKVVTYKGGDYPEVKAHVLKIHKCINNKKGKNKQ